MTASILCGSVIAACRCASDIGHDGDHECECGGRWRGDDRDGHAQPTRMPQRGLLFETGWSDLLDAMFRGAS